MATENLAAHLTAQSHAEQPTTIIVQPQVGGMPAQEAEGIGTSGRYEAIRRGSDRLPPTVDTTQDPIYGRVPVPYEPQGYMHVSTRTNEDQTLSELIRRREELIRENEEGAKAAAAGEEQVLMEQNQNIGEPLDDFYSDQGFQSLISGFRNEHGQYLAMTAYGAVPLPPKMLETIPEKLVSRPLIQERDVFVLKQEEKLRVSEQEYTQYHHRFVEVPQSVSVNQYEVKKDTRVIEIPKFDYRPQVEEKIVDLPLGIKYVEVPIEVRCQPPPRIIPVPKPHIIERIIEKTKPVVQEKIIEVPEIVKKKVNKVVVKEVPYVVPKYVEKVIEVPYQPGQELPPPKGAPLSTIPKPPPLPSREGDHPAQAGTPPGQGRAPQPGRPPHPPTAGSPPSHPRAPAPASVEEDVLAVSPEARESGKPQTFYISPQIRNVKLPYEAKIDISMVQMKDVPPGAPIAQPHVRYMAPGSRAVAYNEQSSNQDDQSGIDPVYAGPMDPVIGHAQPGMRAVQFTTRAADPDILTRQGVMKFSKFEYCLNKDGTQLMPKLPLHPLVPMDAGGSPDLKKLVYMNVQQAQRVSPEVLKTGGGNVENDEEGEL